MNSVIWIVNERGALYRREEHWICRKDSLHNRTVIREGKHNQNFVTSVKLKSLTFMAGTTMSKDSSPQDLTGTLIASTFDSM